MVCNASDVALTNSIVIPIFLILVFITAIFIMITMNNSNNSQNMLSKLQVKLIQFFKTEYNNYKDLQSIFIPDGINVESTQPIIMSVLN